MFNSGLSFGSGKSNDLEKREHDGIMYLDTPGLADINRRNMAAQKITKALRQNGMYQIFFVVSLSAGRIRIEDLKTIWLVLMNTPDIKIVNIIINKLSKQEYDSLQSIDEIKKSSLLAILQTIDRDFQYNVLPLLLNEAIEDADDMTASFPGLDNFVREVPWESIHPTRVNEIPGEDESFREQLNSNTDEMIHILADKLLISVRQLLILCTSLCFLIF